MLIGICGKKRSGKDTVANILIEKYGFVKYSFADPLKQACKIIFDFTDEQLYGDSKEVIDERWGVSCREILQKVGTELFRQTLPGISLAFNDKIGSNIWVKSFEYWYEKNKDKNIVIADVRYANEVFIVRHLHGQVWKTERKAVEVNDGHASEKELESIFPDIDIDNNSSMEDLESIVHEVMISMYGQTMQLKS